ncbi:MAG: hypothetical protein JJU13_12350, partial [Balneolaceae bacterium]|nr:hypothetical protein [Balneolaceae bacterium]
VMTWDQGEKNQFIESYGLEAYKSLVARHFKDGHAEYQAPETQSDMPIDHEVRNWTPKQRDNFVEKYGRDTYQQRMANAFKNDKEPVN